MRASRQMYAVIMFLAGALAWAALLGLNATSLSLGPALPLLAGKHLILSPWLLLGALFLLSWAAVPYKFSMMSGYYVSFDIAFALAAFFLAAPIYGLLIALSASVLDIVIRAKKEPRQSFYHWLLLENTGNRMLRFAGVLLAYQLTGGTFPPSETPRCLLAAAAAFMAYFLANNIFFLPTEYFKGADLKLFVFESFTVDLKHTLSIFALGYLLSILAAGTATGIASFLLLALFTLMGSALLHYLTTAQANLKRKVEDLTLLGRVSAAASSGLDVMPMVEAFSRALCKELGADGIGVVFYHRYASSVYLVQVEGDKSRSTTLPEEKRFQYEGLPLSEASPRLGERLFEFLLPLETAPFVIPPSVYGVPLIHGGEPFGGIVIYSSRQSADYSMRQELLDTCVQSLVIGLENCFLHLQAIQDPLTGLYNRSYFLYRLEEELAYSSRHRAPFALLMADLDDFKVVNDQLGHETGDRVLRKIGDLFRAALRREDVPSRYGGDEFLLLLVNCDQKAALEKAEKIRQIISARALPREESRGIAMGCSFAVLSSENLHGEQDVPTILRRLDQALYHAKASGKNLVVLAE